MPRIFVTALAAGEVTITGDEHHYLHRVRRARVGDAVELVDGAGMRAAAVIERITGDHTVVRAEAPSQVTAAPPHVRVLLPLIKGDRMDTCLEKLVEVGADEIVLWPAARAVVRLEPDRREARLAKYRAALQAGARQCGRQILRQRGERTFPAGHHEGAGDPCGITFRQALGQCTAVARVAQYELIGGVAVGQGAHRSKSAEVSAN